MKQFAPSQSKEKVRKKPAAAAHGNKSRSRPISASIDHILHLHQTIGNKAVQRMFKSGILQLKSSTQPKLGDVYSREIDRLMQRVEKNLSIPLLQQKANIAVKQTKEILPANSSYQLTAMSDDLPLMPNVETSSHPPHSPGQTKHVSDTSAKESEYSHFYTTGHLSSHPLCRIIQTQPWMPPVYRYPTMGPIQMSSYLNTDKEDHEIYMIFDTATKKEEVQYIGRTNQGIATRFGQHKAKKGWPNTYKWQKLAGGKWTLFEVATHEQYWIMEAGGVYILDNEINGITYEKYKKYRTPTGQSHNANQELGLWNKVW